MKSNPECSICQGSGILFEHSTAETCFCVRPGSQNDNTEVNRLRILAKSLLTMAIAYENGYPQDRMPFSLSELIKEAEDLRVIDK